MTAEETLSFDDLQLKIRPSVSWRARETDGHAVIYLSLVAEEIDDRFATFLVRADPCDLEPTDAIVFYRASGIEVARGASCTFPLYRFTRSLAPVQIATHLPVAEGRLRGAGLLEAIAAASVRASFEPNALTTTPVPGWERFRRGMSTRLEESVWRETPIVQNVIVSDEDEVVERIQRGFAAFRHSQRSVRTSVLELSGGYDSTLAASARASHHAMLGVSVEFPFYEFRFEAAVQRAAGIALGIPRTALDGTRLFPYSPWTVPPRFDEPSVYVTGIRHAEVVGEFAEAAGATRIYTGHGGDHLFGVDLTDDESETSSFARAAFSGVAWRTIRAASEQLGDPRWRRRAEGCFVYDARHDVWAKERFGTTVRTPFTDLALMRAGLAWSAHCRANHVRPDKNILVRAVPDLLPAVVVARRGKVAYDGVWMRGYAKHGRHIGDTIERASSVLEHIGFSPNWLLKRAADLANWQPVEAGEVIAGYAVATWLAAWGIDRSSAVTWELTQD